MQLSKQFGVFPLEFFSLNGKFDFQQFNELSYFEGTTVIIQSFEVEDGYFIDNSLEYDVLKTFDKKMVNKVETLIPRTNNLIYNIPQKTFDLMSYQIGILNRFLSPIETSFKGGIVYLSGISFKYQEHVEENLTSSDFLPWYMYIADKIDSFRVFRQPELNNLLQQLPEKSPRIKNLDNLIEEMDRNFDD